MHQSRRGAWLGLGKRRVDVTRRGRTWTHAACVCVCVWRPHTSTDAWECIGFSCAVWERHCPLSLHFYLVPSPACGLLSCEHAATIKDLFISFWASFFLCKKSSFTEALQSNSHSSQFISYCQTSSNWELVGIQVLIINATSLWLVRIRWRKYVSCSCMSTRGFAKTMLPFNTQQTHTPTHADSYTVEAPAASPLQTVVRLKHSVA